MGWSAQWVVFGFALVLLVLRLPEAIVRAEFWAEDGLFYSEALARGMSTIIDPYAGYLIVGIRAVALIETAGPPLYAPLVGNAVSLVVMAAVAAFATSRRMRWNQSAGVLISLGIVLVPIGFELVGTLVHIVWPLTLWMALVALSREPSTGAGRALESAGLVAAGLTGIGAVLASPLFFRGPRRRLLVISAVGIAQLAIAALTIGERPGSAGADWLSVPYVWLLRAVMTPLVGDSLASAVPMVATVLIAGTVLIVCGVLLWRAPRSIGALVILFTVAIPLTGIIAGGESTADLMRPAWAPRYFWSAAVGLVVLLALNRERLIAMPIIALLLLGVVLEFRIHPASEVGWADLSGCIGGTEPCEIPVAPGDKWNVRWQP